MSHLGSWSRWVLYSAQSEDAWFLSWTSACSGFPKRRKDVLWQSAVNLHRDKYMHSGENAKTWLQLENCDINSVLKQSQRPDIETTGTLRHS